MKRIIFLFIILFCFLLTLPAQNISKRAEQKLQDKMAEANMALIEGKRQEALDTYKEIRKDGGYCQTAFVANDSLAFNSFDAIDIETLYDCVRFIDKYLEKFPGDELIQEKKEGYLKLYYALKNNMVFQDDLCGIWVSDYTEDDHKAPYLILEIERTDTGYVAHLHPNCHMTWKYPTYQYYGKYKYYESTELSHTKCGIRWEKDSVYAHFADNTYKKAYPEGSRLAAGAGIKIIESAREVFDDVTSDPDFFRQPIDVKTEVYLTTLAVVSVGVALGIVSALLQNSTGYGYSITFQGVHPVRGEMECTLIEEVLEVSSSTGKLENKFKEIKMRLLKVYPDYDVRFVGYNNWLVGSHTYTNDEAKLFPEYKYKKEKALENNTKCYNQLFQSFLDSHRESPDDIKEHINNNYGKYLDANKGNTHGVISTEYGYYTGDMQNGKPLPYKTRHFFKQNNSYYFGSVEDNKRVGKGLDFEYSDSSTLVRKTDGTWENGELSGYAIQDNYVLHQHFEGSFSDGYRTGHGVLTDTANNIVFDGTWEAYHWDDCLNGSVTERDLQGNVFFNGEYKNNERDGFGTEYYENGSSFSGYWKNGQKHGKGVLRTSDPNESYQEKWKKGELKNSKKL